MIIDSEKKPIESIVSGAFEGVKGLIDANTVVGSPIKTENGSVIIPITKITLGIVGGGGEYGGADDKYAGVNGVGLSVTPLAFLVGSDEEIKLVNVGDKSAFDKIVDAVGQITETIVQAIK